METDRQLDGRRTNGFFARSYLTEYCLLMGNRDNLVDRIIIILGCKLASPSEFYRAVTIYLERIKSMQKCRYTNIQLGGINFACFFDLGF